jgi:hypothetical protein
VEPAGEGLRDEAKEPRSDARPQTRIKPEAYSLKYVEDFSGSRTPQTAADRSPQ